MKIQMHLEENEKVTALGVAKALCDFVNETNDFNCTSRYVRPLFLEDIADILKIICESDKRWAEIVMELQNER